MYEYCGGLLKLLNVKGETEKRSRKNCHWRIYERFETWEISYLLWNWRFM